MEDVVLTMDRNATHVAAYQTVARKNGEGIPVARGNTPETFDLFYCGRFIGAEDLPGSDGYCGPNSGLQCVSCREFQQNPSPEPVAPQVTKHEPVQTSPDITTSVITTSAPTTGPPTNADRFEWRRSLLRSLVADGHITKQQYRAKIKENRVKFEHEQAVKPVKNSKLSVEALLLLEMLDKSEDLVTSKLQELWHKYDLDKNGVLDFQEAVFFFTDLEDASLALITQSLGSLGAIAASTAKDVMGSPDFNQLKYGNHYKALDANGDGTIDFGEFVAFLKQQVKETAKSRQQREELKQVTQIMDNGCAQQ